MNTKKVEEALNKFLKKAKDNPRYYSQNIN